MNVKGVIIVEDLPPRANSEAPGSSGALEHVANKPIAHHVLDVLASAGIEEVVVVSSSESAGAVRACLATRGDGSDGPNDELRIRYVEQPAPLGLDDALSLAAPLIGEATCVVHLATGLLEQPLEPLIARVGRDTPDLIATVHQASDPEWHLNAPTQAMLHLAELRPERATLSMAGVCVFGPGGLGHASKMAWRSRGGSDMDLTRVAAEITARGGNFQVLPVCGWCRYAGDPLSLLELNRIALDRMHHETHGPSSDGNLIEGRVWIHEQASVRTSVIVGPAVVGPSAQISDAYIGPYTSIGAGARIEGAEIERSIIAAGASIMHVGSRLVASVVGRDARVFRDFSLPRAVRLRVGDGTEIALC
jgi:glucose-1-phosphate thymidylyltransferase